MTEKTIERNDIRLIDKERCGIEIHTWEMKSMSEAKKTIIIVKDETSKKAFETFKKIKEAVK